MRVERPEGTERSFSATRNAALTSERSARMEMFAFWKLEGLQRSFAISSGPMPAWSQRVMAILGLMGVEIVFFASSG